MLSGPLLPSLRSAFGLSGSNRTALAVLAVGQAGRHDTADHPRAPRRLRTVLGSLCAAALLAVGTSANATVPTASTVHLPALAPGATSSAFLPVTVTVATAGTISGIQVLTQGVANADFRDAGGGTCSAGQSYFPGQSCTVNVVLAPTYPGTHTGAIVLQGSTGPLATQFIDGYSRGPLGLIIPGIITTVAGNGAWIYRQDGVPAVNAPIFLPMGTAVDAAGNLFLSDANNNRIRRVDAATGIISTIAGIGDPGYSGDHGPALNALISTPSALVLDGAGNLYFADSGNHLIRRIEASGIITTVAGIAGQQGYAGDSGLATAALLNQPYGLALDAAQNLYIADTGNNVIRKLSLVSGLITTVAGTGVQGYFGDGGPAAAALLSTPWGLNFAPDGSLYIADLNNNVIRRLSASGIITTVVGTGARGFAGDAGLASAARLNAPAAVVLDVAGNIYVADSGNNRVRKVSASTGLINTIAGTAGDSNGGDGGNSNSASLYGPYSLLLDGPGNLYISDMFHNRIRRISSNAASLLYTTIRVNRTSAPQSESFENDGNADLNLNTLSLDSNSTLDTTTTTCFAGAVLTSTSACGLGVEFAPTTVGTGITGSITLRSDVANTPGILSLSGDVLSVDPTSVTVSSSANPSGFGSPVIFTANVSTTGTSVTGTIQFLDGATPLGTATLNAGTASLTVSTLALGSHPITAVYSGDSANAASTSTVLTELIKQSTSLALVSGLNPSIVSGPVTFTATLTGTTGNPVGTIVFSDGSTTLGIAPLTPAGTASLTVSTLTPGTHTITASYSGDSANMNSKSPAVAQTVAQASTLTTLGTSNASVTVGTTITFTASVISNSGPMPTGAVAFKDGALTLGTGNLDSAGVATFSSNLLAPAQHPITAVYQGDTNSISSTSTVLNETIQQIATSTSLVSSANPANAGGPLLLTATVSAAGGSTAGGALTGLVTFQDGATTLGTGTLAPSGVATLSVTTLSVGQHNITAVYAGNTNYATSTSAGIAQKIQQATTTTTLGSSINPAIAGKSITLTATVNGVGSAPTGTVTFRDGTAVLGQGQLDPQGIATLTTSSLNVNSHTIVATYNPDANNLASSSTPLVQSVQIAATFLALTATPNPAIAGAAVTFTATLTGNGGQPTGAILFKDGANVIGTLPLNGSAPVSLTLSTLSVGPHPITASYAGDANDSASTSTIVAQVIQQAATSTSLTTSQSPSQLGQSITFSTSVLNTGSSLAPTGAVTFMDGTTPLGTASLVPSGTTSTATAIFTYSTLALGNHTITAIYSGDANHAASTSSPTSQQVLQATAIALVSSTNPSIAGKPVIFSAKLPGVPSLLPTGTVSFKDGVTVLGVGTVDATGAASFTTSSLAIGAHNITAVYSGDNNFQAVTSTVLTQTIQIAQTNIALTSSANPAIFGSPLAFSATITGTGGNITGTVTFQDGTSVLGSATLNASGVAVFSTTTLSPGIHSISALYSGDSNNLPNNSAVLQQQVRQVTQTTLASSANPSLTLNTVTLTCSVTNGGTIPASGSVTFTEGASVLGTVTLDATGLATLTLPTLAAGTHPITASYAGDLADLPSASPVLSQTVQLRPTTAVLTATATSLTGGQQLTLISVVRWTGPVAPTGTVAFKYGNQVLGNSPVDKAGVATLTIVLDLSPANMIATYSGDSVYTPSDSPQTSISSGQATQFTLTTSNAAVQLQSKQHITVDLTLSSIKGFSDTIALGCLGLPYAATCTFSTDQSKLAADGTQVVHLVIDTGSPLTAGSVAMVETSRSSTATLCFLPVGALLGIFLYRGRRRVSLGGLLLLLCALGMSLGATGCGSLNLNGTPPGAYTFKITAAGMNTGVSQSRDMSLTVTQ